MPPDPEVGKLLLDVGLDHDGLLVPGWERRGKLALNGMPFENFRLISLRGLREPGVTGSAESGGRWTWAVELACVEQ